MCVCPSYKRASLNDGPISMDLARDCTFSLHLTYRFGFGFYYLLFHGLTMKIGIAISKFGKCSNDYLNLLIISPKLFTNHQFTEFI